IGTQHYQYQYLAQGSSEFTARARADSRHPLHRRSLGGEYPQESRSRRFNGPRTGGVKSPDRSKHHWKRAKPACYHARTELGTVVAKYRATSTKSWRSEERRVGKGGKTGW